MDLCYAHPRSVSDLKMFPRQCRRERHQTHREYRRARDWSRRCRKLCILRQPKSEAQSFLIGAICKIAQRAHLGVVERNIRLGTMGPIHTCWIIELKGDEPVVQIYTSARPHSDGRRAPDFVIIITGYS